MSKRIALAGKAPVDAIPSNNKEQEMYETKVLLINPEDFTVKYVEWDKSHQQLCKLLDCKWIERVKDSTRQTLYLDEIGKLKKDKDGNAKQDKDGNTIYRELNNAWWFYPLTFGKPQYVEFCGKALLVRESIGIHPRLLNLNKTPESVLAELGWDETDSEI